MATDALKRRLNVSAERVLGPNVVTNQQARIGIGSVSTGTLGGTDGRLYELRSGYGKDLSMYGFEDYTRIKHVMSYIGH